MPIVITEFSMDAYDQVLELWRASEGVGLSDADSREGIRRYLERNPETSLLAWDGPRLVGAVLCGHDGRRGFINHLAVLAECRRRGIGRALIEQCLAALESAGIPKAHVFVLRHNDSGLRFWQDLGWTLRNDLSLFSKILP